MDTHGSFLNPLTIMHFYLQAAEPKITGEAPAENKENRVCNIILCISVYFYNVYMQTSDKI